MMLNLTAYYGQSRKWAIVFSAALAPLVHKLEHREENIKIRQNWENFSLDDKSRLVEETQNAVSVLEVCVSVKFVCRQVVSTC